MSITIARLLDLEEMVDIYNYYIENTTSTFALEPISFNDRKPWFRQHNKNNHPLYVYKRNGQVLGYVSLSPYRNMAAYNSTVELSVYVHRDYHGQGIGKELMDFIIDYAKNDPTIHMIISVITADNEVSIKLHEKYGFEFSGRIKEAGMKFGKYLDIVNYCLLV